jgi:ribosomal-protein-alanine N-acetyltransferase
MEGAAALSRLLVARVGEEWPPPLFDAEALEWALDQVRIDDTENEVEIGYSVLPSYHRRGLASEAVAALMAHAFDLHGVARIVAHTLMHLDPSIGVLRKNGFTLEAELDDEGVVRFEREAW